MKLVDGCRLAKVGALDGWLLTWEHCGTRVESVAFRRPEHREPTVAGFVASCEMAHSAVRSALELLAQKRPKSRVSRAEQFTMMKCLLSVMGLERDAQTLRSFTKDEYNAKVDAVTKERAALDERKRCV